MIAKLDILEDETPENVKIYEELFKAYKSTVKPLVFWQGDPKNTWVKFLKHFEYLYSVLEESGFKSPKDLTVFEFYNKIDYIKKRQKEAEKSAKR